MKNDRIKDTGWTSLFVNVIEFLLIGRRFVIDLDRLCDQCLVTNAEYIREHIIIFLPRPRPFKMIHES